MGKDVCDALSITYTVDSLGGFLTEGGRVVFAELSTASV